MSRQARLFGGSQSASDIHAPHSIAPAPVATPTPVELATAPAGQFYQSGCCQPSCIGSAQQETVSFYGLELSRIVLTLARPRTPAWGIPSTSTIPCGKKNYLCSMSFFTCARARHPLSEVFAANRHAFRLKSTRAIPYIAFPHREENHRVRTLDIGYSMFVGENSATATNRTDMNARMYRRPTKAAQQCHYCAHTSQQDQCSRDTPFWTAPTSSTIDVSTWDRLQAAKYCACELQKIPQRPHSEHYQPQHSIGRLESVHV